ncbi:isochorismate synthase [Actinokineospora globicatena]|uniref:isochorismate synthase n=1 Tax=Actinokineospora globicatena TaxID=103729 RepID=A0A9W6V930_9PSEU|nr:isochorismate synthase [Actinokineospora globicatena]GLW92927.1 isochorismate synthase [Actinokineospora globicatena]
MDGGPAALVEGYRPGSFVLAAPGVTVAAEGTRAVVAETDPDELAALVTKQLVDTGAPVAVGAIPFSQDARSHVVVPESARRLGGVHPYRPSLARWAPSRPDTTDVPDAAGYRRAVAAAVSALRADDGLRKVVLARSSRLLFDEPVRVAELLAGLTATNPLGYTFAAGLPDGSTLLGASPELLLERSGSRVVSNPLAGSLPRGGEPSADRANAAALLASAKNQAEHGVVVESVVEVLRPFCRNLAVEGPSLVGTPTMWHLSTRVSGDLVDRDVSSLRLAAALHPTPAVCGTPTAAARAAIAELEPFDRGFYSGAVGWCTADGDGQWVLAIRCAQVSGREMRLFAGAGIMPDSDPEAELAETQAKLRTLLQAMGL